jgi:DNA-binding LytR/AlgR family response regulator
VQSARLAACVARLRKRLEVDAGAGDAARAEALQAAMAQLGSLLGGAALASQGGGPGGGRITWQGGGAFAGQVTGQGAGGVGGPVTGAAPAPRLTVIQAQIGSVVHLVPVREVVYVEAADKYLRVLTTEREYLIRTSMRELLPQLDPEQFWQIHRGTVVQAACIETALRDEAGKVTLTLRGRPDRLAVSRLYAHLFKGM